MFQRGRDDEEPFQCVASTGLSFHGIPVPNSNAAYSFADCEASEKPDSNGAYRGLTPYLLAAGGRILRMLNIADRAELVSLLTRPLPSGLPPGLSDRKSVQVLQGKRGAPDTTRVKVDGMTYELLDRQHFTPLYRCAESIVPTDSFHHRFLGASFGASESGGRAYCEGMIRLIRTMKARPFVRHDALLLGDISRIAKHYFRQWTQFNSIAQSTACLLYTSPSPRDRTRSRMPSSA